MRYACNQERVESLNYFNRRVSFYLSKQSLVLTSFLLATANRMSCLVDSVRLHTGAKCIYIRISENAVYINKNNPMKKTETILQYYNTLYTRRGSIAIVKVMPGAG